ncbi:hypothetical protein E1176_15030 [Fulvivirga sp. RKSG066]|uniref:hypothetical protein n=1 Tax=Fulvivirga aurantia TaxID=2529383 RepID=UPI0012BD5B71|nr:hypothetical protein [Fulvivirga aurantia]MTI22344.1 hypothetical protein [Fulvivirga aurantia]
MKRAFKVLLLLLVLFAATNGVFAQQDQLYKTVIVRATPGGLPSLIDKLKSDLGKIVENGGEQGYLLRHSQGDQWDLMLIVPIATYNEYFNGKSAEILERTYGSGYYDLIARQEEAFVSGPSLEEFKAVFEPHSFFHIEMFLSLGGKQQELLKERQMENTYLNDTGRAGNLIFVRENGFKWDVFTIGGYKSLESYAAGANQPEEVQEAAAKKAGFESASHIGFYLRELLNEHRDTLAGKVE